MENTTASVRNLPRVLHSMPGNAKKNKPQEVRKHFMNFTGYDRGDPNISFNEVHLPFIPISDGKGDPIQIIRDCSGWSLASQTLHRQIWKLRGRRPLPVSAFPRRHQRAVANTLRRQTVRQHGLPKRCKPCKGAGSLRGGSGTALRVLGLVGYQTLRVEAARNIAMSGFEHAVWAPCAWNFEFFPLSELRIRRFSDQQGTETVSLSLKCCAFLWK